MRLMCASIIANLLFLTTTLAGQLPNPVPFLNQTLMPTATAPGGAEFTLTVTGAGFVSGSVVNWNHTPRTTTFVSHSQLTAAITSSDIAEPTTAEVTVTNPVPGGGTSNSSFFQIIPSHTELSFSRTDLATDTAPVAVVTGDFNGDGKFDAVVVNSNCSASGCATEGSISILLGSGQGTFQAPVNYPTGYDPTWIATGDFDGDGKLDLAVAYHGCASATACPGGIAIFLGKGDGSFKNSVTYETGDDPRYVAIGDLNGDGKLDLVVTNYSGNTVSILLGNGDGSFQPHSDLTSGGTSPTSVAIADFNLDGKLDFAVTNTCASSPSCSAGNVVVFQGNGDGTFQAPQSYATQDAPHSAIAADFNHDGIPDLLMVDCINASCSSSSVSIYLGTSNGTFQAPSHINTSREMWQLSAGDFNGDGYLDLAASGSHIPCAGCAEDFADAILFLGKGDGTFQTNVQFQTGSHPNSIATGDFNDDGKLDLITADTGGNGVSTIAQFYAPTILFKQERCATQYGEYVTFQATVSGYRAGITPTGTIAFSSLNLFLGTAPLSDTGIATLSTAALPVGANELTAGYSGDAIFVPGLNSNGLACVIGRSFVSVSVSATPNPSLVGQEVTFTAIVTPNSSGTAVPTGSIRFSDRRAPDTVTVPLVNGQASFTTNFTKAGNYYLKAYYLGDSNYGATGGFAHEIVQK
jgi:hypothetical protein